MAKSKAQGSKYVVIRNDMARAALNKEKHNQGGTP